MKLAMATTTRTPAPAKSSIADNVTVALVGLGWPERVAMQAVEDAMATASDADRDAVPALLRLALANLGPQQLVPLQGGSASA